MISTPHRQTAAALINDAVTTGARRAKACCELEISDRTLRRWTKNGQVHADQRTLVPRPEPANKLSATERAAVLEACNSTEFASLPPCQIVPTAAPFSMQMLVRKTRNAGQEKPETGNPLDPSGSTPKPKSAPLK